MPQNKFLIILFTFNGTYCILNWFKKYCKNMAIYNTLLNSSISLLLCATCINGF